MKDAAEGGDQIRGEPSSGQGLKDGRVVAVGPYMGAANPADEVGRAAIEMEKGGRDHSHSGRVDLGFFGPILGKALEGREVNIAVVPNKVLEEGDGVVGRGKASPRLRILVEEPGLPQGEENVPKGGLRTKTLGEVVLTEGLVQFSKDTRVAGVQF